MPLRNTKDFAFPFKTGFDVITLEWHTRATVSKSKDKNGIKKEDISCCYHNFIDILRRLLVDMMSPRLLHVYCDPLLLKGFYSGDLQTCWVFVVYV